MGEWQARKHGPNKRRTWLKLNVGIDEHTGEILAAGVTPNSTHDGAVLPELLDVIEDEIDQVSADGAYDQSHCYDAIDEREATAAIPPRRDAKIWFYGNRKDPAHPRDWEPQTQRRGCNDSKPFSQVRYVLGRWKPKRPS